MIVENVDFETGQKAFDSEGLWTMCEKQDIVLKAIGIVDPWDIAIEKYDGQLEKMKDLKNYFDLQELERIANLSVPSRPRGITLHFRKRKTSHWMSIPARLEIFYSLNDTVY